MYKINAGVNKFIDFVLTNTGWIIVVLLTMLTFVFSQLGTKHAENGSIHSVVQSYDEYGRILNVSVPGLEHFEQRDLITIESYYLGQDEVAVVDEEGVTVILRYGYDGVREKPAEELSVLKETNKAIEEIDPEFKLNSIWIANNRRIVTLEELIEKYDNELALISSGKLKGITERTLISRFGNQEFHWTGEYRLDKIFKVVTNDIFAWVMVIVLAVAGVVIKIQGVRSGKISGLKLIWKTSLRHATLAEKISPHAKDAEQICTRMNQDELRSQRERRLNYVAMKYLDVFQEDGTFRDSINFVKVQIHTIRTSKGKLKYKLDSYQRKLLKKQKKLVEFLKTYYPAEVHIHSLIETKQAYKERFHLGTSIEAYEKKKFRRNIVSSIFTVAPLVTSVSVFVYSKNSMNLLVGVLGTLVNVSSLLFNMFAAYGFITDNYQDSLVKKSDILLQIGNELGVADENDNNWNAYIEEEEKRILKRKAEDR